jgi:hypothetical protein
MRKTSKNKNKTGELETLPGGNMPIDPRTDREAAWDWIWQTDGIFGPLDFLSDSRKSSLRQ